MHIVIHLFNNSIVCDYVRVHAVKHHDVCIHICDLDINIKGLNHSLLKKIKMASWTLIIAILVIQ